MDAGLKRLRARFYRSDRGREPVREWLKTLQLEDRKVIGEEIKDVEFSWPIGMPLARSLGREIWEVRSSLPPGGLQGCCSAWSKGLWCFFTRSSTKRRRLHNRTLI